MKSSVLILFSMLLCCGSEAEQVDPETTTALSKEEVAARGDTKDDIAEDFCKANGWYDDGVCDWFCLGGDSDCDETPLGPDPEGVATKHPIVLVHGFMASYSTGGAGMFYIVRALEKDGHVTYFSETPPFSSTEQRSVAIEEYLEDLLVATGAEKVNLIAHSMGGLDSRYLISKNGLDRSDIVASLTTLGTPHRGTKLADIAGELPSSWDKVLDALASIYGKNISQSASDNTTDFRGALDSLSEKEAVNFNQLHPNVAGVKYQSYAGIGTITGIANPLAPEVCDDKILSNEGTYARLSAVFWPIVPVIAEIGFTDTEPNDGLILVRSAKWGDFLGCIPADHLEMSGDGTNEPNENTGFLAPRLFRQIAFNLSAQGL